MDIIPFAITTSASGAYNGTVDIRAPRLLYAVEWIDGTLGDGGTAVFSLTNTTSGVGRTVLTLTAPNDDAWYYPRNTEHNTSGSALTTYCLPVVTGALKLAVTGMGSVTAGSAICYVLEA